MSLSSPVELEEGVYCKPLINLDILKEYMRADKYPKVLIYIPNTLA